MTRHMDQLGRQGLLCAAACCAMAVEVPQMGIQALGSCPTGAMREDFTSNTGYGLGVFADWEVGAGKGLFLRNAAEARARCGPKESILLDAKVKSSLDPSLVSLRRICARCAEGGLHAPVFSAALTLTRGETLAVAGGAAAAGPGAAGPKKITAP